MLEILSAYVPTFSAQAGVIFKIFAKFMLVHSLKLFCWKPMSCQVRDIKNKMF